MFIKSQDKPQLITVMGLPGSGVLSILKQIKIPGVDTQNVLKVKNVNAETKKIMKESLQNGQSVVVDIAKLNKKQRIAFLSEFKNINCYKTCVCIMSPYASCLQRAIPEFVKECFCHWAPPHYTEGYDSVVLRYHDPDDIMKSYTLDNFFAMAKTFDQGNDHHELSLGDHCMQAANYIATKTTHDEQLLVAALLHDNGKIDTQTNLNAKGLEDGQLHYYQHHCAGAYNSMFYTKNMGMSNKEILDVANTIYFHMHTRISWSQSSKAMNRDHRHLSEKVLNYIAILNEADVAAHQSLELKPHEQILNLFSENSELIIDRSEK